MLFKVEYGIASPMEMEKKHGFTVIFFLFIFTLGFSLIVNIPALQKNFLFADEAIYFSMTQSIAQDLDLEYTRQDLIRYYRAFDAGPLGIFLKKAKNDKIYYAKSFAYPLFAAPFVKVFGCNGFFVFHSLLLLLMLLMGYTYFSRSNAPPLAFLTVFTFLFASVASVYFLWMSPDFFNLTLIFAVLFLWLYKFAPAENNGPTGEKGCIHAFLMSDGSDYLACALAGIAVFSKPPNIAVMGPLILFTLLKKRFLKSFLMVIIFLAVSTLFWGSNQLITGEWNYQGGNRKTFYGRGGYPLEKEHLTFESQGGIMSSEGYAQKHLYPPRVFIYNFFYYFFGRFTGITWYYFPAMLALFLFLFRRKQLYQWLILVALAGEILIYCIFMPDNYGGGGGALANRYFLNIYPLFLFLPGLKRNFKQAGWAWAVAALFIAQILINPLQHSHFPATHAKKFPFTWLPVELTLVNNFPTNTNPAARRQEVGMKYTWLYFLDDNFIPRTSSQLEKTGFWTRGDNRAEMVLRTYYPIKEITFRILNNPRRKNQVTVKFGGQKKKVDLGYKKWGKVTFTPKKFFRMNEWIHIYQLSIKADKGSIPHFETDDSIEKRYLGVYFELDIIPEYMPD